MKVCELGYGLGMVALVLGAAPARGAVAADYFERVATLPVFSNLPQGVDAGEETVAEIAAAARDGAILVYTDSPGERIGLVDIGNPAAPAPAGTVALVSLEGVTPAAYGEALPTVDKQLVVDLLPAMRASQGWISDKPEGLAITSDGRVSP